MPRDDLILVFRTQLTKIAPSPKPDNQIYAIQNFRFKGIDIDAVQLKVITLLGEGRTNMATFLSDFA
jgi:hypothetical protein